MYKELISKHLKLIPIENLEFIEEKLLPSTSTVKANTAKKEIYNSLPELLESKNILIKDSIDILFALYSGTYYKISQDAEERYRLSPTKNPIVVRNQIVKTVQDDIKLSLQEELSRKKEAGRRVGFDLPEDSKIVKESSSYSEEMTSITREEESQPSSTTITSQDKGTRTDSPLRKQEQYKEILGLSNEEFAQFLSTTPEQLRNKIIDNTLSRIESDKKPSLDMSPHAAARQVTVGTQVGSRDD